MRSRVRLVFVTLTILAISPGCAGGRKVPITQYPAFWQPELKRVAVIPFSSKTGSAGDGETLAGQVQAALVRNGTYDVFTREQAHLQGIDSEKVLSMVESGQYEETRRIGRLATVQALLVFHCINNFGWYPPLPHGRGSEKRRPTPETLSAMEH